MIDLLIIFLLFCIVKQQNFVTSTYPDVFLLGERKCATTTLKKVILSHKAFCQLQDKDEAHFFQKEVDYAYYETAGFTEYNKRHEGIINNNKGYYIIYLIIIIISLYNLFIRL